MVIAQITFAKKDSLTKIERSNSMFSLENLDSVLWADYRGAYGNLYDLIHDFSSSDNVTDKEEILETISENLSHQMTFYLGTYLGIPYLVRELLDTNDISWQINLISNIGIILATDCECETSNKDALPEIINAYNAAISDLSEFVKKFVVENKEAIKNIQGFDKEQFAVAVFSILGDRNLAFTIINCSFEYCLTMCTSCDEYNEDIESFSMEDSSDGGYKCITPAPIPDILSDEYDFSNNYHWFCQFSSSSPRPTSLSGVSQEEGAVDLGKRAGSLPLG